MHQLVYRQKRVSTAAYHNVVTQSGATLLELMLAISIGSIVLLIAWSMYTAVVKQYLYQENARRLAYRSQRIIAILKSEIAQTGYIGCPLLKGDFPITSKSSETITDENKISINDNRITIRHAAQPPASLIAIDDDRRFIKTDIGQRFKEGQIVLITDCSHGEIADVVKLRRYKNFQYVTLSHSLNSRFNEDAEVSRLEVNSYYVVNRQLKMKDIHGQESIIDNDIENISFQNADDDRKDAGINISLQMKQGDVIKQWYSYAPLS